MSSWRLPAVAVGPPVGRRVAVDHGGVVAVLDAVRLWFTARKEKMERSEGWKTYLFIHVVK